MRRTFFTILLTATFLVPPGALVASAQACDPTPVLQGVWSILNDRVSEPDTLCDLTGSGGVPLTWATPNPSPVDRIYLNGLQLEAASSSFVSGAESLLTSVTTRFTPTSAYSHAAWFGFWRDCDGDATIGSAIHGSVSYPITPSLPASALTICPAGTAYNDGINLIEFIPITNKPPVSYDAIDRTVASTLGDWAVDHLYIDPLLLPRAHDPNARVWFDFNTPDALPRQPSGGVYGPIPWYSRGSLDDGGSVIGATGQSRDTNAYVAADYFLPGSAREVENQASMIPIGYVRDRYNDSRDAQSGQPYVSHMWDCSGSLFGVNAPTPSTGARLHWDGSLIPTLQEATAPINTRGWPPRASCESREVERTAGPVSNLERDPAPFKVKRAADDAFSLVGNLWKGAYTWIQLDPTQAHGQRHALTYYAHVSAGVAAGLGVNGPSWIHLGISPSLATALPAGGATLRYGSDHCTPDGAHITGLWDCDPDAWTPACDRCPHITVHKGYELRDVDCQELTLGSKARFGFTARVDPPTPNQFFEHAPDWQTSPDSAGFYLVNAADPTTTKPWSGSGC